MTRTLYRFKIQGCEVELEQQWAVRIKFGPNDVMHHPPGYSGVTMEKALHLDKETAVRAICERMGGIVDEERGLPEGTGEMLVAGAIREELDG